MDDRILSVWLQGRAQNTVKYYRKDLLALDSWLQKTRAISVNDVPAAEDLVHYLETVPRTPAMKEQSKLVIRSFFRFLAENGYAEKNPARVLKLSKPRDVIASRIPTIESIRSICQAAADVHKDELLRRRDPLVCEFAFVTGARLHEIAQLNKDHIQAVKAGVQVELFGKGSKTRWVLMPAEFANRLTAFIKEHGLPFVFPNERGDAALGSSGVYDVVKMAARKAGHKRFSTHWFRHGHASESISNGCPLTVVQATLGHSNIATTSRYLHARPETSSALYLSLKETTFLAKERNIEVTEPSKSHR